jgi:hypothetical protein
VTKYVFVLCPPFSGSTVLWQLLATSPNASALPTEGQFVDAVRDVMWEDRWNPEVDFPWPMIKREWERVWDLAKPVLLEKSPPNLIRARAIGETFCPAYFLAMVRNPYAFCEGYERRRHTGMTYAARFWVECAQRQLTNVEHLERVILLTYEELTQNTCDVSDRILRFVPELGRLDTGATITAESILGFGPRRIRNLNQIKINQLSTRDIFEINYVLANHTDLLCRFGYGLLHPSRGRTLRRCMSFLPLRLVQLTSYPRRARRRIEALLGRRRL